MVRSEQQTADILTAYGITVSLVLSRFVEWLVIFTYQVFSDQTAYISQCVHSTKATITWCDLSPRFFCNDATLLCEFENDKI